ncbi:MAG: RHS repeat-associated core domain-containing protein [Kouleothrix sp.]|nr:RHS repeat-associated core domain-containing protein [Kouleothrix sp.]
MITTYNLANQITNAGYTYDLAGNLANDGTATATFDALNRMTTRGTTTYGYNGDGALISQLTAGITTRYTQDLAAPLSQVLQSFTGATRTDYLYGANRIATQTSNVRTWYVADALGSVRRTVSDAGVPQGSISYDPWGTVESGTVPTFGFTGELQQGGLVNLRARWYNAGHGRFGSVDPFAGVGEQPYSLHPYQYAYSNPINYIDATGKFACLSAIADAVSSGGFGSHLYYEYCLNSYSMADVYVDAEGQSDALGTLIKLFTDGRLPGGTTSTATQLRRSGLTSAAERLEFILDYTQDWKMVPFRKTFNDTGFNQKFKDPWPVDSGNQVGHFLTATGLAYSPSYYVNNIISKVGLLTGGIITKSSEDAALRLIVGHEKVSDKVGGKLATIHAQYGAATDADIAKFLQALAYDEEGDYGARDALLCEIVQLPEGTSKANTDIIHASGRVGNSVEDLRLSLKGYIFGLKIKDRRIASLQQAGKWLEDNLR